MSFRASKGLLIFTILLGLTPFLIYAAGRLSGALPSEQAWQSVGGNHGPWQDDIRGDFILYSMYLLPILGFRTFVSGVGRSFQSKSALPFLQGTALAALQVGVAYAQLSVVPNFWLCPGRFSQ